MKKHFIPLTALALMALVSCGGGNNPSSSASSGTSQSASSSQTTQASDPSSEKSSESVSEKSSEETSASDSESSTESGSESSSESSSEAVDYAVAISNKNALTAEWHLGEADRAVEFDLAPRTNITQAIADGVLTIVSSNPEVVQVLGRNLHAAGEGTATITVTYGDKTDTVEITVLAMLGEPAFEQKNLTAVMGVEDLVTSGSNKYSKVAFLTKVKVAVIGSKKDGSNPADKYGNLYVTDPSIENDAELVQVYGASATFTALSHQNDGYYKFVNPQDYLKNDATKDIKVGDILDVIAIRADYNTTKEISIVIRSVNGAPVANREVASGDVAGFELTDNEKKLFYKVSGKIDGWKDANTTDGTKYGNFFIKTEGSNNPVYVYGATASANAISFNEDGSLRFTNPKDFLTNEATKDLKIGDEVTLIGFRCDYNGTVELNGIIVTNAEPTPVVPAKTSLENLANGDTVDIPELTVTAVSDKGFAVTDGTRGAYVYVGSVPTVKVNNVIALKGNVEEYHGYLQISSPTVMVLEDKTPKVANATILTAEGATALKTASGLEAAKLYKWRAKATKDGNFWLFNIDGSDTKLEPVNVPESFGLVEGNTYDVEAYFTAYDTKYNFAQFLLVSAVEEVVAQPVYGLVGTFNDWSTTAFGDAYTLNKSSEKKDGKDMYILNGLELAADAEFKVVGVLGDTVTWYPEGMGNNYKVAAAGKYNIHFVPAGGIEGWHGGFFEVVAASDVITDVLNNATTGVSGTGYSDWTATSDSGVSYAGQSAGGNKSIQLRSKSSNSGVVVTANTQGLIATKVIIAWNSNTVANRVLNLYGSDFVYEAATDLYDEEDDGDLLASLAYDGAAKEAGTSEFDLTTINHEYSFLGFRSAADAIYINSITIVWKAA